MRRDLALGLLAAGAALLVSACSTLASSKWIGTWELNTAESKYSPGPAPRSQTVRFSVAGDSIMLTSDGVGADGTPTHTGYVSRFDGKDVPWDGNPDADIASPLKIDANNYDNIWKQTGKATMISRVTVSADGRTMTVVQKGTNENGEPVSVTAVYDRR
ncbi:MAG TPA: hypothetical protein VKH43_12295 [Thermoanaerobaculia bacterium]|nr:hypothetical protein [Thermoanaerobaculia bacterium]